MSAIATKGSGDGVKAGAGAAAAGRSLASGWWTVPAFWLMAGILALALGAVFHVFLFKQFGVGGFSWSKFEDWGHSYLVPAISGYFVWRERERLAALRVMIFWPGAMLIVLGVACYAFFLAGYPNHMFQGFSMILALSGVILLVLGPRVFAALIMPIVFLGLAVTISEMVMNKITWAAKLLASQGSWILLNIVGVETELAGNTLTITDSKGVAHPLNVADACSGMRMVIAFIALAAAVAMLACREWWKRFAVVLLALPVSLGMNIVRVAILGVATLIDPALSQGQAHKLIGFVLLPFSLVLFLGAVWALNRILREESEGSGAKGAAA